MYNNNDRLIKLHCIFIQRMCVFAWPNERTLWNCFMISLEIQL